MTPRQVSSTDSLASLLSVGLANRPEQSAILDANSALSFLELETMALASAQYMSQTGGVRKGDRILVLADKRLEIVAAAIAIWKVGAIYVPVDPDNPPKRISYILSTIEPKLVISSRKRLDDVANLLGDTHTLSYEELRDLVFVPSDPPMAKSAADDAAVIIHTSGSTGTPKGVTLSHASVLTYFYNHNAFLGFGIDSRSMNNGPFHFDVSIQDTFLPLFFGATVAFHGGLLVSSVMSAFIKTKHITHLIAVSSVLELISKDQEKLEALKTSDIKVVVTGGEICAPRLINRWIEAIPGVRVLYGYGPTEMNSLCTTYVITQSEPGRESLYPIGKPFTGIKALLLKEGGDVIEASDEVGVLAVSGPQIMMGYWRDPELTARSLFQWDGDTYYVTGDRCYRDSDGNYHFAGRQDTEVKIRGRRINLNEIRNALLGSSQVHHAVVTTVQNSDETRIAAYINVTSVGKFDEAALRRDIAERLLEYMVPSYLCLSSELYTTSTGKIDEKGIIRRMRELVNAYPIRQIQVLE